MNEKPSNPAMTPETVSIHGNNGVTKTGPAIGPDHITLRDYFAGLAMQGAIVAATNDTTIIDEVFLEAISANAYRAADAMLKAREVAS